MIQAWPRSAEKKDCPVAYSNRQYDKSETSTTKEKPFVTKLKQQTILRIFKRNLSSHYFSGRRESTMKLNPTPLGYLSSSRYMKTITARSTTLQRLWTLYSPAKFQDGNATWRSQSVVADDSSFLGCYEMTLGKQYVTNVWKAVLSSCPGTSRQGGWERALLRPIHT
jgi:hypothetical protein